MCLMSLCSCTKIIGGNHTPPFAIQVGRELLIAYLVGDGGGRGDGDLLVPTVLHPWGEGNKRCVILGEGVMLCGVTSTANSCFKVYIVLLIRNWSSRCPISRGNSQGFHVLSSRDLTKGYHLLIRSFGRVTCCLCGDASRASASVSTSQAVPSFPFRHPSIQSAGRRRSGPACLPSRCVPHSLAGRTAESKQDREQPRG